MLKLTFMSLSVCSKLAYDDFIAVAEDLIARGVTSPAKLGTRMLRYVVPCLTVPTYCWSHLE
jgi:hypothetical protein